MDGARRQLADLRGGDARVLRPDATANRVGRRAGAGRGRDAAQRHREPVLRATPRRRPFHGEAERELLPNTGDCAGGERSGARIADQVCVHPQGRPLLLCATKGAARAAGRLRVRRFRQRRERKRARAYPAAARSASPKHGARLLPHRSENQGQRKPQGSCRRARGALGGPRWRRVRVEARDVDGRAARGDGGGGRRLSVRAPTIPAGTQ